jgi:hypothetical protein
LISCEDDSISFSSPEASLLNRDFCASFPSGKWLTTTWTVPRKQQAYLSDLVFSSKVANLILTPTWARSKGGTIACSNDLLFFQPPVRLLYIASDFDFKMKHSKKDCEYVIMV